MLTMVRRMHDAGTVSMLSIDTIEDALMRLGTSAVDWSLAFLSENHVPVFIFTRLTGDEYVPMATRGLEHGDTAIIVTRLDDGTRTFWLVSKDGQPILVHTS